MHTGVFRSLRHYWHSLDVPLVGSAVLITLAGIVTMHSYASENIFFERQLIWLAVALSVFVLFSLLDFRFLRRTSIVVLLFALTALALIAVFVFGDVVKGAQSRFDLGFFALQPADPAKIVIIALLAKYFTRRHIAIANIRHILVSGAYAFALFVLIALQPDFGSAIMIFFVWLGMVLVSGISKKHFALVMVLGTVTALSLWFAPLHHALDTQEPLLKEYQKQRIITFLHPLADVQGTGYNAYQSTIAVGSGQLLGKGIGYGTQSKLQFLPEYETDFIFASFAEEWGFIGVVLLFALFGILFWRILAHAHIGATNFETLFALGLAILFLSHFTVHVGMNIGLLPVTGVTLPFMSYGGSHLVTEFAALGMLMSMYRYARVVHKEDTQREFVGLGSTRS